MYPTFQQMSAIRRSVVASSRLASDTRNRLTVRAKPTPIALLKSREVEEADRSMCSATSLSRSERCRFYCT